MKEWTYHRCSGFIFCDEYVIAENVNRKDGELIVDTINRVHNFSDPGRSQATPASGQILALENRVAELEQQLEKMELGYRTVRGTLANMGQSVYELTDSARRTLNTFPLDLLKGEPDNAW